MSLVQSTVIDTMGLDGTSGHVKMAIIEERNWTDDHAIWLKQLEEKVNTYLRYALHGQMLEDNPQYQGKHVDICLFCAYTPPEHFHHNFLLIRKQLHSVNISFDVFVGPNSQGELSHIGFE